MRIECRTPSRKNYRFHSPAPPKRHGVLPSLAATDGQRLTAEWQTAGHDSCSTVRVSEGTRNARVIRAPTPPRDGGSHLDARETLWELRHGTDPPIRADLIGLTDGVEIELFRGETFRRRWRFLTDSSARAYAARVRARLERRSFRERRTLQRTSVWLG